MAEIAIGVAVILGTVFPVSGCHHWSKVGTVSMSYWFWICWQRYKYKTIWAEFWKTGELITFCSLISFGRWTCCWRQQIALKIC